MLERAARFGPWYSRAAAGAIAFALGGVALIAGYWSQFATGRPVPSVGEPAVFVPIFGVTLLVFVVALVRRERPLGLPIAGLAMAIAAPLVGWVVLVAAIAAVALAVALVIAKFY